MLTPLPDLPILTWTPHGRQKARKITTYNKKNTKARNVHDYWLLNKGAWVALTPPVFFVAAWPQNTSRRPGFQEFHRKNLRRVNELLEMHSSSVFFFFSSPFSFPRLLSTLCFWAYESVWNLHTNHSADPSPQLCPHSWVSLGNS